MADQGGKKAIGGIGLLIVFFTHMRRYRCGHLKIVYRRQRHYVCRSSAQLSGRPFVVGPTIR